MQRGVTLVWSRSPQVTDLFDYIGRSAKSSRPLALAGFDLQFMSRTSESLLEELDALVDIQHARQAECRQPPVVSPSIELEELLNAARFDYALLNFRKPAAHGEWLRDPIVSRPLGSRGMRAVWPNVVDAMLFIRVMEPNRATNPARSK